MTATEGADNTAAQIFDSTQSADANAELEAALAKSAAHITQHMNRDHGMSVLAYAHMWFDKSATAATMTGLNAKGFLLRVTMPDKMVHENVLIHYSSALISAGQVRKVAVAMHFEAFHGLGFRYKMNSGYYKHYVQMGLKHTPTPVLIGGAALAAAAAVVAGMFLLRQITLN